MRILKHVASAPLIPTRFRPHEDEILKSIISKKKKKKKNRFGSVGTILTTTLVGKLYHDQAELQENSLSRTPGTLTMI